MFCIEMTFGWKNYKLFQEFSVLIFSIIHHKTKQQIAVVKLTSNALIKLLLKVIS